MARTNKVNALTSAQSLLNQWVEDYQRQLTPTDKLKLGSIGPLALNEIFSRALWHYVHQLVCLCSDANESDEQSMLTDIIHLALMGEEVAIPPDLLDQSKAIHELTQLIKCGIAKQYSQLFQDKLRHEFDKWLVQRLAAKAA